MIHELYSMALPNEKEKTLLYYRCLGNVQRKENLFFFLSENSELELSTYFNSFSLEKWKQYTTIKQLFLKGIVAGFFRVEVYGVSADTEQVVKSYLVTSNFELSLDIENLSYEILYVKFIAEKAESILYSFSYYGLFDSWENVNINGIICTYCREKYVQKNIHILNTFKQREKWFSLTVIDNGQTLTEQNEDGFQIIHNLNYGGSAGFTRGIIESLHKMSLDYILLMDDDIEFDVMILKKTHALLCGLKTSLKESFLSGAMLNMGSPCTQYENTAYWNVIKGISVGHNLDLSKKRSLTINEKKRIKENQYAAWWYCCIPIERVKQIGLPLPIFIKGDDLEYSIRNAREIMTLNGIAVWHEEFQKKNSLWVQYLADRNMMMMNFFVKRGTKSGLLLAVTLRLFRRMIDLKKVSLLVFACSLSDLIKGLSYIAEYGGNKAYIDTVVSNVHEKSILHILKNIVKNSMILFKKYKVIRKDYLNFRNQNLKKSDFWKNYLGIN